LTLPDDGTLQQSYAAAMGVGLFQVGILAFAVWLIAFVGHQMGRERERSGVTMAKRALRKSEAGERNMPELRCWVCHTRFPIELHHSETGTCGASGCVDRVMTGRARMAQVRVDTDQTRIQQVREPALRRDGTQIHTPDGVPVTMPVAGRYELTSGGEPDAADRRALAWAREHGV